MWQTVLVMVRSSLVGAAIWDGRAHHVGWLAPGALALVTAWSLGTIIVKRRVGRHDRARLIHALDRVIQSRGVQPVVLPVRQQARR